MPKFESFLVLSVGGGGLVDEESLGDGVDRNGVEGGGYFLVKILSFNKIELFRLIWVAGFFILS